MNEQFRRTPLGFHRYMFDRIMWQERLVGLVGPRGVGKSTMVKQYILGQPDRDEWLYVSVDHSYFSDHSIAYLADECVKEGITHLVIDEIHKYANWSRELKEIYDGHPSLNVIFTGSSVLDILKGQADLSRRALMFAMQGLSFREFLKLFHDIDLPVYSLEEILGNRVELPLDFHPLPLFRDYLRYGYYPFSTPETYAMRLQQVVAQTVEVDIPQYAGMNVSTTRKLRQLLAVIAKSTPVKPSMQNLSTELKVSKNDVPDYLLYLEKAGMLAQVRDETGGFRG
ncbi:MAG: AAA family ATPase, partial [Duncaniella sp.]|nr:AAA family ATPase [Duncaniella sp.]